MRVRVLGALHVGAGGNSLSLGPPKQRTALALLLVRAGVAVSIDMLVDELWGDPPASALTNLRAYIGGLRRLFAADPVVALAKRGSGYLATITENQFDLPQWRKSLRVGQSALDENPVAAVANLEQGLGLWRGPALADVPLGPVLAAWQVGVHEQRAAATEDMIGALIRLGRLDAATEQARDLLAANPVRERAAALLMRARYQAGDPAGALSVYTDLRRSLVDSLGIEPGYEICALQRQILNRDPELEMTQRQTVKTSLPRGAAVVPRQLPPDVPGFAGRSESLRRLDLLLSREPSTVVISAIAGTAGVGKTALAVHWAHRVADRFPDGQAYVNLRGFDPNESAMSASEALHALLDALNVAPQRIPASLDAQAGLYRSLLVGRRLLIVLDNARDAEQVRPLLPGAPGCMVLVTSRSLLSPLNSGEGAHLLTVELLTVEEARDMLARRIGQQRVADEPEAVDEIIACCARLPMAVAIVAARAAAHPDFDLSAIADQLRRFRGGLDGFDTGGAVTMRAVFSWSYQTLSPAAAMLFRLLGLTHGQDVTAAAAASLAGRPESEVRPALAELAHAHLLTEHQVGRYTFHDLLRAYAAELAHEVNLAEGQNSPEHRIIDHYLHTAYAADRLLRPHREPIALDPPQPGVTPEQLTDHDQALAWFNAEHPVLIAAIHHAAAAGLDAHVWRLAWALENFLDWRGRHRDLAAVLQTAFAAAQRLNDPVAQAHTLRGMARAQTQMGHHDRAVDFLNQALQLFLDLGDQGGQAATHRSLGVVLMCQGRHHEALEHEQQALKLHRAAGYVAGQAMTLNNIGYQYCLLNEHEKALAYCRRALAMHEEIGDTYEVARTWDSLGLVYSHLGDHDEALACYQRSITLCRDLGDRTKEAETLTRLGEAYETAGDGEMARNVWRQASKILDELGHPEASRVAERARRHGA